MSKVVIEVQNVHKKFKLPTERISSVKSVFTGFKKFRKKTFKTQNALNGISFEVKEGEFFGIVGRNGSGKSTLLKMLAGIYQPTSGSIHTTGKIVPFIELGVGFNPELSGRDNVYLNGAMLGFTEKEVLAKYKDIVEFAELEQFMDQKLKNYSSGMQVRLAFSVATILAESDILLLDEVLAVGDADFQRKCFNYFKTLKKNNKTVVFVSHDMNAVREYCDSAILIDKGKIVASGTSTAVSNEYTKLFINNTESGGPKGSSLRTGTGVARIGDFKKNITVKSKEEKISIKFEIKAVEDVENVAIGFKCKSADDKHLFGTNNIIVGEKIKLLKAGEKVSVCFDFDNMLNNGNYLVDLAIESAEGEVFDWILDAIRIDVKTEKKTSYLLEPKINLELKHDK